MRSTLWIACVITLPLTLASPRALGGGDIYVGLDEKGNPFFTDTPPTYEGFKRFYSEPSRSGSIYKDFARNFQRFDPSILANASLWGIDAALIKAVVFAESAFNPQAKSKAGAQGLMQLMPHVQTRLGVKDPYDPEQNLRGGTELLAQLLRKYDGDTRLALAAYNAGPGAVAKYGGVPPYTETQGYVKKVESLYAHFLAKGLGQRP